MRYPMHRLATSAVLCLIVLGAGCRSTPSSTRMTVDDIEAMGAAMAQSLAASDALRNRDGDSPRWTISIERVLNLSSDVMTESEQWGIMARLRSSLPIAAMAGQYNVHFVLPPERIQMLANHPDAPELGDGLTQSRAATHTMTATFRSVTRATQNRRTELYFCEFELFDIAGGQPVWNDRFEYKREARGHIWN